MVFQKGRFVSATEIELNHCSTWLYHNRHDSRFNVVDLPRGSIPRSSANSEQTTASAPISNWSAARIFVSRSALSWEYSSQPWVLFWLDRSVSRPVSNCHAAVRHAPCKRLSPHWRTPSTRWIQGSLIAASRMNRTRSVSDPESPCHPAAFCAEWM